MGKSKERGAEIMSYKLGKNIRIEHPLKTEIYKHGYNITEFADIIGIDRWTLWHVFKNKSMPRGDTVYMIAKGLEIPYEKVIELCQR